MKLSEAKSKALRYAIEHLRRASLSETYGYNGLGAAYGSSDLVTRLEKARRQVISRLEKLLVKRRRRRINRKPAV